MDDKLIKILSDSGISLGGLYLGYLLFNRILTWLFEVWTKRMEGQDRSHDYQREEHKGQSLELLKANQKLDVLVKRHV